VEDESVYGYGAQSQLDLDGRGGLMSAGLSQTQDRSRLPEDIILSQQPVPDPGAVLAGGCTLSVNDRTFPRVRPQHSCPGI